MPFRILVAGDFGGQASEPAPIAIDLDNFDQVLNTLAPSVEVLGMQFVFRELDDFHPDHLYQQSSRFRELRQSATAAKQPPSPSRSPAKQGRGSLLDSIVEEDAEREAPVSVEDASDLSGFLRRATAGHVEEPEDVGARQRGDESAGELMRAILHDPAFQALEKAWRSLYFLVRGTDATTSVSLLNVDLPEFVRTLEPLRERLQKRGTWSLVVGDYLFGQGDTDAAVLERLGAFSKALGATFLGGAYPPADAGSERWQTLRRSEFAAFIGLVIPRFLLRLPYGKETSTIDAFPLEEMPVSVHGDYLWANGAFAAALLIGSAYAADDSQWKRRVERRIDGLPLHVYEEDGESIAKPCAEVLMTERDAESLLDVGLMPLASLKEQDGVLLVRFQSISEPAASLAVLEPGRP